MKQSHSVCTPRIQGTSPSERRGAVIRYLRELGIPEGGLRKIVKQRGAVAQVWKSLQERQRDPREDSDADDGMERHIAA